MTLMFSVDSHLKVDWYTSMSDTTVFERDRAYQRLSGLILNGELDTNTPLSERKLSEFLNIGRTPVREAIKRLTREGLVEVRPARGTYVRQLTLHDIEEIYEARFGIEGIAAYLAAERGPTPAFVDYKAKFSAMIANPSDFDLTEIHECGQRFHVEIFEAARNKTLMEIYKPLRLKHSFALRLPRIYDHSWVIASVREHLDVLEAIEQRDPVKARSLVCDHLMRGLEVRSRIFDGLAHAQQPSIERKVASA